MNAFRFDHTKLADYDLQQFVKAARVAGYTILDLPDSIDGRSSAALFPILQLTAEGVISTQLRSASAEEKVGPLVEASLDTLLSNLPPSVIRTRYLTPDGEVFDTVAEAEKHAKMQGLIAQMKQEKVIPEEHILPAVRWFLNCV